MGGMIFDASVMKWRKRTQADVDWANAVIKEAFPELKPKSTEAKK